MKERSALLFYDTEFYTKLHRFPEEERAMIQKAYNMSEEAHKGQRRLSGEPFFIHPRAAAMILLGECELNDHHMIEGALLHDAPEDTDFFGSPMNISYEQWIQSVQSKISNALSYPTSYIVTTLSKPRKNNKDITSKRQIQIIKKEKLTKATHKALIVKAADNLHNLRTKEYLNKDQYDALIDKTTSLYLPLFQSAASTYPYAGNYLISQISSHL